MAILINVLQDKRRNSNHLWYGRAVQPHTIDTAALAHRIQANVSVKEADVMSVLIELADVLVEECVVCLGNAQRHKVVELAENVGVAGLQIAVARHVGAGDNHTHNAVGTRGHRAQRTVCEINFNSW